MEKKNKKVICINADANKEYEQIIFVMKDEKAAYAMKSKGRMNFVLEAERIINQKLEGSSFHKAQQNAVLRKGEGISQLIIKKSSSFDIVLNVCMMVGCLFLTGMLVFMM